MTIRILFLSLFLLTGCSTLKRSVLTGAMSGATLGATGGAVFSPTQSDRNKNAYLFGVLGAALGSGIGYLFFESPKDTKLQSPMLLDEKKKSSERDRFKKEVPLFDFSEELKSVKPEVNFKPVKRFDVPIKKDIPPELKGKIKDQHIIEYEAKARTINLGNRTIEISPFKAWEVIYE